MDAANLAAGSWRTHLKLNSSFVPDYGRPRRLADRVHRITAPNPSPFTFHGTNTYIVGTKTLAIIDPGPDSDTHLNSLMEFIAGRTVSHIFVTHTHRDHSDLVPRLTAVTHAKTVAEGAHRPSRPMRGGETETLDTSSDRTFRPEIVLNDGARISGDGWTIEAVHTPGHTKNHCAFSLVDKGILFSGDHVMGWATTIVAPPSGKMSDYMTSLDKLLTRPERLYLPGHGDVLKNPKSYMKALKAHRKMRERAVLQRIRGGDRVISDIVTALYRDTDPRLHAAAALSVFAHLEDLVERGLVRATGEPSPSAAYFPV